MNDGDDEGGGDYDNMQRRIVKLEHNKFAGNAGFRRREIMPSNENEKKILSTAPTHTNKTLYTLFMKFLFYYVLSVVYMVALKMAEMNMYALKWLPMCRWMIS